MTTYSFVDESGETRLRGTIDPAPGGSSPVSCLLARDAPFDIRLDSLDTNVLWDALYDDLWNLDPLVAIPAGLGLTFAFDGSSSLIVPTEAGIWSLSYSAFRAVDNSWVGSFALGVGINLPWIQQAFGAQGFGVSYMVSSVTLALPAGAQLTNLVAPTTEATAGTYTCPQVYLSIVRLG